MSDYCEIAKPLTADIGCDTQTLNGVAKHNEQYDEICGE